MIGYALCSEFRTYFRVYLLPCTSGKEEQPLQNELEHFCCFCCVVVVDKLWKITNMGLQNCALTWLALRGYLTHSLARSLTHSSTTTTCATE